MTAIEDKAREVLVAELLAIAFLDCTGNSQRDFATYRAMLAFRNDTLDEAAKVAREEARLFRVAQEAATASTDKAYRMGQKDALLIFADTLAALKDTPSIASEDQRP